MTVVGEGPPPPSGIPKESRESPQFDVGELQVSHDLQLVDAAEVLHAVSELEQVGSVHRQLELMGLAQDEDLGGGGRRRRR